MNNTSSQNQSVVMRRKMSRNLNGSMPPYHPSLGKAFSNSANKFGLGNIVNEFYPDDVGMPIVPDPGKSGYPPQPHLERNLNFIDYTDLRASDFGIIPAFQSANLPVLIGVGLIYVASGAPGYRPVVRQAKKIIRKPEKYVRTAAMATGVAILVAYGQAYR
tara:strand:+ start:357 stop:839 length:483 start_codon:yes stop_codon:yes gene_type:complete